MSRADAFKQRCQLIKTKQGVERSIRFPPYFKMALALSRFQ